MPRLKILGKPSMFAGDDIRIPMIFGMAFRVLQIGMAFPLMVRTLKSEYLKTDSEMIPYCIENGIEDDDVRTWPLLHARNLLIGYTASSGVVAVIGLVEFASMFYLSQKGTPSNPGPRKRLDLIVSINFSITFCIRIGTFLYAIVIAAVAVHFCGCVDEYLSGNDGIDDPGRLLLTNVNNAEYACWMVRSGWITCLLVLFFSQLTDVIFGGLYYITRITGYIPRGILFRADTKWELCCRCCFTCLSCLTCFRMGGIETIGRGELQHFASIISEYFESDGILDVAPTDILVGLHITKLIHLEEEYTVRQKLCNKSAIAIEADSKKIALSRIGEEEQEERKSNAITENWVCQTEVVEEESESSVPVQNWERINDGDNANIVEPESLVCVAEVGSESKSNVPSEHHESNKDDTYIVGRESRVGQAKIGDRIESMEPIEKQDSKEDDDSMFPGLETLARHTEEQFEDAGTQMVESERKEGAVHPSMYSPKSDSPPPPPQSIRNRSRASVMMFRRTKYTDDENPVHLSMYSPKSDSPPPPPQSLRNRSRASVMMFSRTKHTDDDENPSYAHESSIQNLLLLVEENAFSPENKEERYLIAEGARYIDFATSIYTWSLHESVFHWDSFTKEELTRKFEQKRRAFLSAPIGHINEEHIVYSNYNAGIEATPYAVVLDHPWKSVVVTIRGSQSIDDMMSDLTLNRTELDRVGEKYGFEGTGRYCHKGILGCAEWVTEDLLQSGTLDRLLLNDDATHRDYQLRIVGHSLGAAAASLVALFLRSKFPAVRAVAFEAPGCTLSRNIAEESCAWCVSFVTGVDVIPRFTVESMADLRDEMLVNIARLKVPKYIVNRNRRVDENGIDAVREFLAEALYPVDEIPETAFLDTLRRFRRYYKSKVAKREQDGDTGLYLPGRIIHLLQGDDTAYEEQCEEDFIACWAGRDNFSFVVLSPHFLLDHGTDEVNVQFDGLTKAFGLKEPYTEVLLKDGD